MMTTDRIRRELVAEFRATARERLERVATSWVAIENRDAAATNGAAILRELHTLKGEAKLLGFGPMSQLVHGLEDLIVAIDRSGYSQPPDIGDLVLRMVDVLTRMSSADAAEPAGEADRDLAATIAERANAIAANRAAAHEPSDKAKTEKIPALRHGPDEPRGSPKPLERDEFVRIDAATAERITDAASEVVIAQGRYRNIALQLRACNSELGAVGSPSSLRIATLHTRFDLLVDRLLDEVHDGSTLARALELDARTLRLVPVAPLFRMHLRAVRELARELGKRASLQISDAGITVDREVVERLAAPLLHLLRNAVDHGLETPEVRRAAGKSEIGRISLSAERVRSDVVVIAEDDGAGIDIAAVRRRAIELGADRDLDDEAALGALFSPSFSTRTNVTETSGRGVGLDIVKRQVESLGGTVRVASQRGRGTRFELRVPISIALTRTVIVEENDQVFAIPHTAVEAVIAVARENMATIHTQRHIMHRGSRLPVVELAAALHLRATTMSRDQLRAIVIVHEGLRAALLVDNCRGDVEVVVKPLGTFASSSVAMGACTLDGGALALVLSPGELVARAFGELPVVRKAAAVAVAATKRRVLLVEDSAITRTMIAQLLRMLDYDVAEAEDGARALRVLESFEAEAIVTDIEMPELDGIAMIERLRKDRRWRDTPVIVLSTRGTPEDKRRAATAGADAYLVKTEFSESVLRETLARHVRAV